MKLQESKYAEPFSYEWPSEYNRVLVLNDFHFPYQDNQAIELSVNYGIKNNINGIILNGDILDMYFLSRFDKRPDKSKLLNEFEVTIDFLQQLRAAFPKAKIVFGKGNHEARWESFLMNQAVPLFGDPYFTIEARCGMDKLGIEVLPHRYNVHAAGLYILHGDTLASTFSNPVNPARGMFNALLTSAAGGHVHRTSSHTETTRDGKIITTWSVGCLCGLRPEYNQDKSKNNHGFGVLE